MTYQETTYQVVNIADASGNIISSFGGNSGGDASAANQTAVQNTPGSDASKAVAVQGVTGGKNIPISSSDLGTKTDTPASSDNDTTASLLGNFKRLLARITTLLGLLPSSLGAKSSANSFAVAIATDQSPLNVATNDTNTTGTITTADIVSATVTGANNQSIITGTPTAGSFVSIAANGYNSFLIQVSNTWTGNLQFEVSFDNGTTYYPSSAFTIGTSYAVASTTLNGAFRGNATDATNIRVRATSAISSTANIRIVLSQTIDTVTVRNPVRTFDSSSGATGTIKSANTLPTASDTASVVSIRESGGFVSSATVTRAANTTTYTANDVYGGAFQLSNIVGIAGGNILLTTISIIFNISALPAGMSGFTLYLYSVTPPSAIADNGAFSLPSGDRASILTPGGISLGSAVLATGGGTVVIEADNLNIQIPTTTTSIYCYLVTAGSFTPAANSETFAVTAKALVL